MTTGLLTNRTGLRIAGGCVESTRPRGSVGFRTMSRFALLILMLAAPTMASGGKFNRVLSTGDRAPEWNSLAGVDGKRHSLADLKKSKLVVVAFIANRCPMAKQYEPRMLAFEGKYRKRGVRFVAISVSRSPVDSLEKMKVRAKKSGFAFPYLIDSSQRIGRAYGATHTPHFFVLDRKRRIAYMGAFDDHRDPAKVEEHYLKDAVDALLAGKRPDIAESRQFGCEIEYRERKDAKNAKGTQRGRQND